MIGQIDGAALLHRRVQSPEEAQGIDVAVQRAIAASDHLGSDLRQDRLQGGPPHHFGLVAQDAGLVVKAHQSLTTAFELRFREAKLKATGALKPDIEPGLRLQIIGKAGPGLR